MSTQIVDPAQVPVTEQPGLAPIAPAQAPSTSLSPFFTPSGPQLGPQPTAPLPVITPQQVFNTYQAVNQNFLDPLTGQPQVQTPADLRAALAQLISAHANLLQDPVLTGQVPVQPDSKLLGHAAKNSGSFLPKAPLDVARNVGLGIFQKTIGDYIHTWQTNPLEALKQTVIGAGLVAGGVGLEVATGGAATPFLLYGGLALGALSVAPDAIHAASEEVQHPSDGNLTKALVSVGAGGLMLWSPFKGIEGLTSARGLLSRQQAAARDLHEAEDVMHLVSGNKGWRQLVDTRRSLRSQFESLASNRTDLGEQADRHGIQGDEDLQALLNEMRSRDERLGAVAGDLGDDPEFNREMQTAQQKVRERERVIAERYGFLLDSPYAGNIPQHLTEKEQALAPELHQGYEFRLRQILGSYDGVGMGFDHHLGHSPLQPEQALELMGRAEGGQARGFGHDELETFWTGLRKHLGISDEQVRKVQKALDTPGEDGAKAFEGLNGPEQLYARALRHAYEVKTLHRLKRGRVQVPLPGRIPHHIKSLVGEGSGPFGTIVGWLRGRDVDFNRLWKASVDWTEEGQPITRWAPGATLAELEAKFAGKQAGFEKYKAMRQTWGEQRDALVRHVRTRAGYKGALTRATKLNDQAAIDRVNARMDQHLQAVRDQHGDDAAALVEAESRDRRTMVTRYPADKEVVLGPDLERADDAAFLLQMQEANLAETMHSAAETSMERLHSWLPLPDEQKQRYGLEIAQKSFRDSHELPLVMPENAFSRSRQGADKITLPLGEGEQADDPKLPGYVPGYVRVVRGVGRPGDLNYKPAAYVRSDVGEPLLQEIASARSMYDVQNALARRFYGLTVAGPKKLIFGTPVWHAFNVMQRTLAFMLNDPVVAGVGLKQLLHDKFHNPEEYQRLVHEAAGHGLMPADRHELRWQAMHLQKEQDGQAAWPIQRMFGQAAGGVAQPYHAMERGFWKTVRDVQLLGYTVMQARLKAKFPEANPRIVNELAAEYGNTLGGTVNPLYMSKLYRQIRNYIFFAPSWWATHGKVVGSMLPFSNTRIAHFLARRDGGKYIRWMDAVPLKFIDNRMRKELTRSYRGMFLTGIMSTLVAMDGLNQVLGGQHLWQNEPGRQWDIDVSKLVDPELSPSGAVKRAYVSFPLGRQPVDDLNFLGLGHDWGFMHTLTEQGFQNADLAEKGTMLAGSVIDGIRRTGSTKLAGLPQVAYGAITGQELPAQLGQGKQVKIDRIESFLPFIPGGYDAQRIASEYQAAVNDPSNPMPLGQAVKQSVEAFAGALTSQYAGIPSLYFMGAEKPMISDDQWQNYLTQRQQEQQMLTSMSTSMMQGAVDPRKYQDYKHDMIQRMLQLDADTFGQDSPAGALTKAELGLRSQLKLDDPSLPPDELAERYDIYNSMWDQLLSQASPEARAVYWEHHTSQWTDADYLKWQADQLNHAVASAIDGQGGIQIRADKAAVAQLIAQGMSATAASQQIQQQDPTYYAYKQAIKNIGNLSPLGALVGAFTSPYSQLHILPPGTTPEQAAELAAENPSAVYMYAQTAAGLAAKARQEAATQQETESGGTATPTEIEEQAQEAAAGENG